MFDIKFATVFLMLSVVNKVIGTPHLNVYHREDTNNLMDLKNTSLPLNRDLNVAVLIHGFRQDGDVQWYADMKSAYFNIPSYGYVIQVDWRKQAHNLNYIKYARQNVKKVGEDVALHLINFLTILEVPFSAVEITGFSLGAHIAGVVGRRVQESLNETVRRINALDPAGPMFQPPNDKLRLRRNDAAAVVVYHTNGDMLGLADAVGTADLYFNNIREPQPGCGKDLVAQCSHSRAVLYFIDGLKTGSFVGILCESFELYHSLQCHDNLKVNFANTFFDKGEGIYFASTNSKAPFDKHPRWLNSSKLRLRCFKLLMFISIIMIIL